ncbi:nuclear transport factor 2 family protein [Sphingomonas canadensis]|uniref:Nuclear transport factor 2 family protein n=1 Tax=Sphingomonas canadensis TaxID=1219257 RepID=A0ABW3H3W9_9SPHN|nr:nuclear transport factor 2 family protein [Sphingomonas canadensis]MCW3835614.1 nuclear transport factor 2 family protein [Sphingomonas canadensis]
MSGWAELAADLANAEAVRAVKRLQHVWGHYAEAGDLAALAELFARDGRLVLPPAEAQGRDAILALLGETMGQGDAAPGPGVLNVRLMMSPVVSIAADGLSAQGRWHEVAMTGRDGATARWSGGIHENLYVLEEGAWKIAALRYHPQYAGDYAEGWNNVSDAVPLVPFHFTPDSAGIPVPPEPGLDDGSDPAALAARAQRLVDEGLIQNLQAAYGQYCDRKMWDDIADLFDADGMLEVAGEGAWSGPAAIRAGLELFGPAGLRHGEFFDHLQLMPVVTIAKDGTSAELRAIELQMLADHGGRGFWGIRIAEARLAKAGGVWRFAALKLTPRLRADYALGWADGLEPLAGGVAGYPEARGPAIGFAHPVRDPAPAALPVADPVLDAARTALAVGKAFDGAENVACAYGYFLDEAHWDESAELFARDGWKELSFIGTYIGRERIRDSLVGRYGRNGRRPTFLPIHQKTQPYVSVSPDGQRAQIRLKMFQVNSAWEGEGSTIAGLYEEQAVIEDGIWRIHGMDLEYIVLSNYRTGPAGVEPGLAYKFSPTPEAIAAFEPRPDGPLRGLPVAPYPDIGPLGFHYANPVSGREPALRFHWSDGRF